MSELNRISLAVLLVSAWCVWCLWLLVRQRQNNPSVDPLARILVAYASQSGTAATLATKKAEELELLGKVNLLPLDSVCRKTLGNTQEAHFIVSTYGQGEPPDNGHRFYTELSKKDAFFDLSHLRYSVTALGDSSYEHFCAFGHNLNKRLATLGAQSEAAVTEIDSQQDGSFSSQVASVAAVTNWKLTHRECLNPNSANAPLYLLTFSTEATKSVDMPKWRAGDVISIQPKHNPKNIQDWLQANKLDGERAIAKGGLTVTLKEYLTEYALPEHLQVSASEPLNWLDSLKLLPKREYSVASAHHENHLKLIVRLQKQLNGQAGIGSGWLTQFSELNDITQGHIRSNKRCHITDVNHPLLLIASGSGLAGLRAQLAERAINPKAGKVCMFYGERSPHHDQMLKDELLQWQQQGVVTDLFFAYSKHPESPTYVQDVVAHHADKIQAIVHQGADIYVCGSKAGMGDGVHQVLSKHLGQENVSALLSSGRYRRDLY
ncbi:flavodoxin domain-containing protein [Paraglaciecola sp.]|uniref:flavodoxin domain-containing protein n=1 Tax=Paraglaciecola sp. TaxID=1920173 RepID=UPI003266BD1E